MRYAGHWLGAPERGSSQTQPNISQTALSQRRADAVRDALIKDGANPDTLVSKGYGSADPIASNDTPEGRLRNPH